MFLLWGIRIILSSIKGNDTSKEKTNKNIIKNLEYDVIFGDEEKLKNQLFVVESNTKNSYKIANITEGDVKHEPTIEKINQLPRYEEWLINLDQGFGSSNQLNYSNMEQKV